MKQPIKRIVSLTLAIAVLLASLAFLAGCAIFTKPGVPTTYPWVFVHGLNGFGEDKLDAIAYWGGSIGGTGLMPMLRAAGYECYAPSGAPEGSAWDRACELYAQLTGGRVDYGKAHSEKFGQQRFGVTYSAPLFAGWGSVDENDNLRKVNLVAHSFGGATARLLAALLKDGDAAEREVSPDDCSPLFAGGKEDWIFSLTCLAAPHNGTSLLAWAQELINSIGGKAIIATLESLGQSWDITRIAKLLEGIPLLDGIADALNDTGRSITGKTITDTIHLLGTPDNAYYDLGIAGAAELNLRTGVSEKMYYFSYPVDGTEFSGDNTKRVPTGEMGFAPLRIPARIIGGWTGLAGAVTVDAAWLPNDGLVNTISAEAPFNELREDVAGAMDWTAAETGRWYVMPVTRGDHGTLIGLGKDEAYLRAFYTELLAGIDALSLQVTGARRPRWG